ncbi:MAG: hypothetical protein ISQ06_15015 [Planctomycetaceae bacterium]|jgi:hypothetical protein|nr:hypothetical protein [Planctomycetaceae bacterium]
MSTTCPQLDESLRPLFWKFGRLSLAMAGVLLSVSGCTQSGDSETAVPPVPVADSKVSVPEPAEQGGNGKSKHRHYEGIGFAIPDSWQELAGQQMVDSKYIIPTEHGEMEMTLTSMGGGIEANLNRWVGQVGREPGEEPTWSTVDVAGIESRKVDVRGSFNSTVGSNPGAKEDWRLIGIAVPLPRDFFIKLVGPREAVVEFKDELDAFLKTAHLDH